MERGAEDVVVLAGPCCACGAILAAVLCRSITRRPGSCCTRVQVSAYLMNPPDPAAAAAAGAPQDPPKLLLQKLLGKLLGKVQGPTGSRDDGGGGGGGDGRTSAPSRMVVAALMAIGQLAMPAAKYFGTKVRRFWGLWVAWYMAGCRGWRPLLSDACAEARVGVSCVGVDVEGIGRAAACLER